ncbi:MAG: GNAT family N-acetyltransferase [Saprospiraceae bacterium]|nr:GNAT family N-acetyltransferase [Saprospiraceae bacterium]
MVLNWLPFYWRGFQQTTFYTYRLNNLQDLDRVFAGCNRNIKRNIKKAETQLTVLEDLDPATFYALNQKSFDRQQIAMPYSLAQFLKHDAALAAHQARKIWYAVDEAQQIHAVAYLIWDKQSSYYHLSGDDTELRSSGAGILLIWKAIQYTANQLQLHTFDFEGSMIPAIEKIRLQFGAIQVPYFFIWKYYTTRYQWLDAIKKWRIKGTKVSLPTPPHTSAHATTPNYPLQTIRCFEGASPYPYPH